VAATIVSDDAIALVGEEQHLLLPPVGAQGPAVAEEDGGTAWGGGLWVPVLVVELGAIAESGVGHLGGVSLVDCVSECLDGVGRWRRELVLRVLFMYSGEVGGDADPTTVSS